MKRTDALLAITHAVATGDKKAAVRIYLENRIGFEAYKAAFAAGLRIQNATSNSNHGGKRD